MRRALRLILTVGPLALAAWTLYLSLFHAWAGGGPPSAHPAWHALWADRFLGCSGGLALAAGVSFWAFRPRGSGG